MSVLKYRRIRTDISTIKQLTKEPVSVERLFTALQLHEPFRNPIPITRISDISSLSIHTAKAALQRLCEMGLVIMSETDRGINIKIKQQGMEQQ